MRGNGEDEVLVGVTREGLEREDRDSGVADLLADHRAEQEGVIPQAARVGEMAIFQDGVLRDFIAHACRRVAFRELTIEELADEVGEAVRWIGAAGGRTAYARLREQVDVSDG